MIRALNFLQLHLIGVVYNLHPHFYVIFGKFLIDVLTSFFCLYPVHI